MEEGKDIRCDDALGGLLSGSGRSAMPAGMEEAIMQRVHRTAAAKRRWRGVLNFLIGLAVSGAVAGLTYELFGWLGIDIAPYFKRLFENTAESFAAANKQNVAIISCAILVAVFYMSINGILTMKARRKALREEK